MNTILKNIFLTVAILCLLFVIFKLAFPSGYVTSNTDNSYKTELAFRDSIINSKNNEINIKNQQLVANTRRLIESQNIIDSLFNRLKISQAAKLKYQKLYEKIPSDVRSLNKDQLRREISEFEP